MRNMGLNRKNCNFIAVLFLIGILLCCGCVSQAPTETGATCTISINCETALDKTTMINADLLDLLPKDGWILEPVQIAFQEGDSVFDVLMHTVREYNIHMEYVDTPIYDSAYIEGINNLYEFDAGAHSGWMYRVNGDFPNYGCSGYSVADGDIIEWVYTCDLGNDVGNDIAERMQ